MKHCKRCSEEKPKTLEFWYRHPSGLSGYCRHCTNDYHKEWKAKNPGRDQAQVRAMKNRRKFLVMSHYSSGSPKCACCNEACFEFLTIDHINGRKLVGHDRRISGIKLYSFLFNNGFPLGYQVLCMNCNWGKYTNGICPHKTAKAVAR